MAVIQISKIQVRRGYQEDIPQLASGELGWSIDERRLFIGNGTLTEGAPEIGITEVLTIYSPIGAALGNIGIIESNLANLTSRVTALEANAASTVFSVTLADNTPTATNTSVILTTTRSIIEYSIIRGIATRVGTITLTQINGVAALQDDYSETTDTGIVLNAFAFGNSSVIRYTSTSTANLATLYYYTPRTFV